MDRNKVREIYYNSGWAGRRANEAEYEAYFTGEKVREKQKKTGKDGKRLPAYPLELNDLQPIVEAHRDIAIGMIPDHDGLPVQISHPNSQLTPIINTILSESGFASEFARGVLMMQYRGGHAFKVAWDPFDAFATYRVKVQGFESSALWPVYNPTDPWNLLEGYIGYEITQEVAAIQYGVKIPSDTGVFLEHWTRHSYSTQIDDKLISFSVDGGREAAGVHKVGCVPLIYMPHHRVNQFWGMNHVDQIATLMKELNLTAADVEDGIYRITHPVPFGGNFGSRGGDLKTRKLVNDRNQVLVEIGDLGDQQNFSGSHPPFADYPSTPQLPEAAPAFINWMDKRMLRATRTSSAALGEMDFSSGRVVGTVMTTMLLPTLMHTQFERMDMARAIRQIVKTILRILSVQQGTLRELGISGIPAITSQDISADASITFYPQVPVEEEAKARTINERVSYGTLSTLSALKELGSKNPEEEAELIWQDYERKAMIDAKAKAAAAPKPEKGTGSHAGTDQAA